jgi:hypothetical protein
VQSLLPDIFHIDFSDGVLMPANDNRGFVDVEQEQFFCRGDVPDQVFFQGKIYCGIMLILVVDNSIAASSRAFECGLVCGQGMIIAQSKYVFLRQLLSTCFGK